MKWICVTTLRTLIGETTLVELLTSQKSFMEDMVRMIDTATEKWGVEVTSVEISDIDLPDNIRRVMGAQAEAKREKAARVVIADGEVLAAEALAKAAGILDSSPGSLQLRYLQTLREIGTENNTTIVFPLPIELLGGLGLKE